MLYETALACRRTPPRLQVDGARRQLRRQGGQKPATPLRAKPPSDELAAADGIGHLRPGAASAAIRLVNDSRFAAQAWKLSRAALATANACQLPYAQRARCLAVSGAIAFLPPCEAKLRLLSSFLDTTHAVGAFVTPKAAQRVSLAAPSHSADCASVRRPNLLRKRCSKPLAGSTRRPHCLSTPPAPRRCPISGCEGAQGFGAGRDR